MIKTKKNDEWNLWIPRFY